jgi:hypothetical protein
MGLQLKLPLFDDVAAPVSSVQLVVRDDDADVRFDRPRTRADCVEGPRPCPWVSCRHHIASDPSRESAAARAFDEDPSQLEQTCSLDVADAGGLTLLEVGRLLRFSRERARQLEQVALAKLRGRLDGRAVVDAADEDVPEKAWLERRRAVVGRLRAP